MEAQTTQKIQLNRVFQASREAVYAAWTDPEAIKQWFGPPTCSAQEDELDLRVGDEYRIKMKTEEFGEIELKGIYREVSPPERLAYSWEWLSEPLCAMGETSVVVEFVDLGDSTEIRLTHDGFPEAEAAENHNEGWSGTLDKLAAYLD